MLKLCSNTGTVTDDESPYVLVASMICITRKDACIRSLLLMKKWEDYRHKMEVTLSAGSLL
jgi:hypothetical protein